MGLSLTGIHIFGTEAPQNVNFSFRSFSPNWLTCVYDFSDAAPDYSYKAARLISKETSAPVLHFRMFDSEMIRFEFFRNGKIVARYSDDEFIANKKLYDIPALLNYEDGNKKRISAILHCSDIDLKIAMLEEFFGVCLLTAPELFDEGNIPSCNRSDSVYRVYQAEEKALTGKAAPIGLNLIAEYPGKLFWNEFNKEKRTFKPHYFLHGYTSDNYFDENNHTLAPVRFTGCSLESSDYDTFEQGRIPHSGIDPRFETDYGTPLKVTFSENCPQEYCGKTMVVPSGFYPLEFLPTGELLLQGNHRIFVTNPTFKIIAKLSIKGDIADIIDNYILTTTGDSF